VLGGRADWICCWLHGLALSESERV
jgi:hypothetical protein